VTEGIRVRGLTFSYPKSPEPAVHGLLRRDGVDQVTHAPWQIAYALVYPGVCLAGLCWLANAKFDRYVIERSGVR